MNLPIFTHLGGRIPLARHDHLAVFYRGRQAAFRLASFLAEGLERGDLCRYLAPSAYHPGMLDQLGAEIGDADRFLKSGTLQVLEGPRESAELSKWTEEVFVEAERLRAPALRWLEEGAWPQVRGFPIAPFFESHALLNYRVKQYASVALCQYDLELLDPAFLFGALAVHRHLIVQDTLTRDNPFYIPAEKFIPMSPEGRERDLANLFREVGFDVEKLLAAIADFGRLQRRPTEES